MAHRLTGKPQLNRFVNRRLILERIRKRGEISRADLAKQTAIRPPTVSAVIKELLHEGLVEEVGAGETSGGRAPRMLALSRGQPRALGFELSDSSIFAVLCDLNGDLCAHSEVRFKPMPPTRAVEQLHKVGASLLKKKGVDWSILQGVGVALPGHLQAETGHVRWSTPFNWKDVPLKRLCEARWSVPTDVVNDSLAGGMAAHLFEGDKAIENLVFLYLRFGEWTHGVIGVGTGIIINGAPYHGQFGAAGEITTPAIHPLVHAAEIDRRGYRTVDELVDALESGAPAAEKAMQRVAAELSKLVVNAVDLLEPGVLMIGTDTPPLRDWLLERFQRALDSHSLPLRAGKTRLSASSLGNHGVARGAIVPTLQRLFRIPSFS